MKPMLFKLVICQVIIIMLVYLQAVRVYLHKHETLVYKQARICLYIKSLIYERIRRNAGLLAS